MCKKLIYLVSFVLVLGLTGAAEATFDTVGVYDPDDDPHHNQVDQSGVYDSHTGNAGPENVVDLATFQALIGPAFDADGGGVVDAESGGFDGQDIIANFGVSGTKSVTISSIGGMIHRSAGVASGNRLPMSGNRHFSKSDAGDFVFDIGPVTGGAPGEAVTYFAGTLVYADHRDVNPQVTATFSGGGTVTAIADMPLGAPSNSKDTFFGFAAPRGESIVNVTFDLAAYTTLDDMAFITSAFVVVSVKAFNPSPADGQTNVVRDVVLGWTPGEYAPPVNGHTVYFSESFDDVNAGIGGVTHSADSYAPPQRLDFNKTYYWRVDEANIPTAGWDEGNVWQFTVEPVAYPIAGENITATASSSNDAEQGPENTINGSGLDADDLHSAENTAMWLSSTIGTQPTWIQYELDKVYKLHQMLVWNHNTSLELVIGFGIKEAVIEYSTDGSNWTTLGTTHEFARATGLPGNAHNTTVDLSGVVAKYVKITANSNWGGIFNQYGLSEVRFFYVPVLAREPDPASGATDTDVEAVLSWRAGREAASHNVYFSADEQAVINETISPVSVPADSSYASYDTGALELDQTYYWKVNEVNEAGTPTTWQGDVWNFTAQEYLVVDDFEDYNDFEPDRIFDTWSDGWADPTKGGSQVGSDVAPFAEQTIVHSGKQSMPLMYDNSTANYSEATANVANLAIGQDWTKYSIKTLVLYFHGDPTNAAEQLYVKLNGSKVAYGGDAVSLARTWWQLWNIDLTSFGVNPAPVAGVGVNLSNVTELSIGLERSGAAGGMGVVYIDDIRLYRSAPAPPGPVNEWRIAANSDDAEEMVVGLGMDLGSSDLELGYEGAMDPANLQTVGCRWVGIPIPKGATITEAWVQFSADSVSNDYHIPDVSLIIEGELSPNPATFSSAASNISSRPTTTASVVWDIPRWMTTHAMGPEERTPDISPIIQEIVNQNGWAGNALVLMFRDNPAKPSQGCREAEAYDGEPAEAPLLHITYQ